jgi:YHS domain-containing protein
MPRRWCVCPSSGFLYRATAIGLAVALSGCGSPSSHEKQKPASPAENAASGVSSPEVPKGLAELSDADAAVAKKQRVCPVSGEVLGAMGKPYKVTVQGKTVFLCCPGCEDELRKDPEKYLSKPKE